MTDTYERVAISYYIFIIGLIAAVGIVGSVQITITTGSITDKSIGIVLILGAAGAVIYMMALFLKEELYC